VVDLDGALHVHHLRAGHIAEGLAAL
jgi:hypothetical protein